MNEFNENFEKGQGFGGPRKHFGGRHGHHQRGEQGHGFGRGDREGFGGRPRGGRGERDFEGGDFEQAPGGFGGRGPRHGGPGRGGPMGRPDDAFMFGGEGPGRGPWGKGGPGRRGGRGPGRGRKGDVRNAILALLKDADLNGYGMISAISEKTDGLWSPSAGSIYPALGLLEDEGLIEPTEAGGKKVYRLTEAGRKHVEEHADQLANPWEKVASPHQGFLDVRSDLHQLGMAVQQVVVAGDQAQLEKAKAILEGARKDIYRLLAE